MKRDNMLELNKIVRRPYFIDELIKPFQKGVRDSISDHFQQYFKQRLIDSDFVKDRALREIKRSINQKLKLEIQLMMKKKHQHSYYDKDRFKIIQTSMEKMFKLDLSEEIEDIKQEII